MAGDVLETVDVVAPSTNFESPEMAMEPSFRGGGAPITASAEEQASVALGQGFTRTDSRHSESGDAVPVSEITLSYVDVDSVFFDIFMDDADRSANGTRRHQVNDSGLAQEELDLQAADGPMPQTRADSCSSWTGAVADLEVELERIEGPRPFGMGADLTPRHALAVGNDFRPGTIIRYNSSSAQFEVNAYWEETASGESVPLTTYSGWGFQILPYIEHLVITKVTAIPDAIPASAAATDAVGPTPNNGADDYAGLVFALDRTVETEILSMSTNESGDAVPAEIISMNLSRFDPPVQVVMPNTASTVLGDFVISGNLFE